MSIFSIKYVQLWLLNQIDYPHMYHCYLNLLNYLSDQRRPSQFDLAFVRNIRKFYTLLFERLLVTTMQVRTHVFS